MTGSQYFLLSDVSRILDVPPHRVVYPLITRQIPEPHRIGGRRMFSWQNIVQIAEKLGKPLPQQADGGAK